MSDQWFLLKDQKQEGPYSYEELTSLIETGSLKRSDLLWKEGMAQWQPADQIEGLFLKAAPPPPPPSPVEAVSPPPPPAAVAPPPPPPAPPAGQYATPPAVNRPHSEPTGQPPFQASAAKPKKKMSGLKLAAIIGGSLIVLLIVVILIALSAARGALRSSEVYNQAMAALLANPEAVQLLGEPVEAGKSVNGEINVSNGSGNAQLSIPVSGSLKNGELDAVGIREAGQWSLTTCELAVDGGEKLNLLAAKPVGQAGLEAGSGNVEDEELPPRQVGGGTASGVAGMLVFDEPGFGFSMNYPEDWDYYLEEGTVHFAAPQGSPAEEVSLMVQILANQSIGGTYSNLNEVLTDIEKIYTDLGGEVVESESGSDYVGDTMYDYVWAGAVYPYENVEYVEMAMVIQRDPEYFYLLMYTVPLDAEDDFSDLVFDQMFDSFRFTSFN